MSKDGADSFKHVYHNGPMGIEQVREALGFTPDYCPMRGGKPLDGLQYDSAIHNRIKSWFKGIDLTDREKVMNAWVKAHNFDLWWIGKAKVSNIHQKLREAKALTDEELAQISNWNGVVPPEALSAHGVKEPMGWAAFAGHLQNVRKEVADLEKLVKLKDKRS
jgi:hypothetical protein